MSGVLFWLVAGLTGGSALMVVLTQNIVRAAAWLLFTLAGTSALYFLLAADFVGATQLIVYVGGTLVLVVFGVMLTAQGPFVSMKAGAGDGHRLAEHAARVGERGRVPEHAAARRGVPRRARSYAPRAADRLPERD